MTQRSTRTSSSWLVLRVGTALTHLPFILKLSPETAVLQSELDSLQCVKMRNENLKSNMPASIDQIYANIMQIINLATSSVALLIVASSNRAALKIKDKGKANRMKLIV